MCNKRTKSQDEAQTASGKTKKDAYHLNEENVPFETAMDLAGDGKFNLGILLLCQLIFLGMILETLGFSYVLPAAQCDLNLSPSVRGWIASIPFMTIIVSSNFWGWFADTYGRKKAMLISTTGGCLFSITSSFAPELISFALIRVCCGLFVSGCSSLAYTYLGEMSAKQSRDKMLILGNTALTVGTAVVPMVAWGILPLDFRFPISVFGYVYRPWRLLTCCFALPMVISSIAIYFVPETPKFLYAQGKLSDALVVLKTMHRINKGTSEKYPVSSLLDASINGKTEQKKYFWTSCLEIFSMPHLPKTLLFSMMQFLVLGAANGFYIWIPDVINKVVNNPSTEARNICKILNTVSTPQDISSLNSTISQLEICDDTLRTEAFTYTIGIGLAATALSVLSAFCLRIVGKRIQLVGFVVTTATVVLIINFSYNPVAALILFLSIQFMGPSVGLCNAFVVEFYPTSIRATAVSITLMVGRLGSIVSTNLIGYLIRVSCPTTFYLFSVLLYVVCGTVFLYPKENKKEIELKKDIEIGAEEKNYNTKL